MQTDWPYSRGARLPSVPSTTAHTPTFTLTLQLTHSNLNLTLPLATQMTLALVQPVILELLDMILEMALALELVVLTLVRMTLM